MSALVAGGNGGSGQIVFTADEQAALATHYPLARRLIIAAQDHGSALKAVGDHIAAYRTFLQKVAA